MHRLNPTEASTSCPGPCPRPRRRWASVAVAATIAVVAVILAEGAAEAGGTLARAAANAGEDLLSWWQAAVLGVVEGVTEYLPISSTGHLLIAARLLGLPDEQGSAGLEAVNTYVVAIQFGAIAAVAGLFWRRFVAMLAGVVGRDPAGRDLFVNLVIAFVPAALLGFLFDDPIEEQLFGPWPVVVTWVLGGLLVLWLERTGRIPSRGVPGAEPGLDPLTSITHRQALVIGLAQCAALIPGTSRSLATILGALLVGVAMTAAVEFSFLLGFATLSAATAYKLASDGGNLVDQFGIADPLIGALFAFGSAVLAIKWLITYLERHDLSVFAWYRFAVAGLAVLLLATGVL